MLLFRFLHPEAFWLFLVLPVFALGRRWLRRRQHGVYFPDVALIRAVARKRPARGHHVLNGLRFLAVIGLILTLARPQTGLRQENRTQNSLDIMLALDTSESMQSTDIPPDRLQAAKNILAQFIQRRPGDRIGLVAFSGQAFSVMPLTTDHDTLRGSLSDIENQVPHVEGTAIGEAVLVGSRRLVAAQTTLLKPTSRVLILATDGACNRGPDPLVCAQTAAQQGVRLYAIGLGGDTPVVRMTKDYDGRVIPLTDAYGRKQYYEPPDEPSLRRMVASSSGAYFRADDQSSFEQAMDEINRLEKHRVTIKDRLVYQEQYPWPLLAALICMCMEGVLARTWFRRLV